MGVGTHTHTHTHTHQTSPPDLVALLAKAHEKVVGLDVAVDKVLVVEVLHPEQQLVGQHQHRLQ